MAALEPYEAGLHAALGRAKGGQARLGQAEHRKILCELRVQKAGGIVALDANDAQVGQGRYTVQELNH